MIFKFGGLTMPKYKEEEEDEKLPEDEEDEDIDGEDLDSDGGSYYDEDSE